MIKIRQAIVVEGRYDKNKLRQLVDAPIFETSGFGIMHDKELLALLRLAAQKRGLIIFTDSDGAGFVIRNYLKGALPKDQVLHAYIPDIPGKERRKRQPGKEGLLGVEGMTPAVIEKALRDAGATIEGEAVARRAPEITKADLYALGLSGTADSAQRRDRLKQALGLPGHLSANGFLEAINVLFSKEEFVEMVEKL
jgi:ribonuclease M5